MFKSIEAEITELQGNLVLRSIATHDDVERLVAFNGIIHGDSVISMTRNLILHHPHTQPQHWLIVEDKSTGAIVSSLCLIPWHWRIDGIEVKSAEMGIVGTLEPYRHRGLIRALDKRFKQLINQEGFDLSHIQGIPYFYRQFGYEYAMPLEGGFRIEPDQIPDRNGHVTFRQAEEHDIPALMRFFDDAAQKLDVHAERDDAVWRYLLGPSMETDMQADTWLVLDTSENIVGYWRIAHHGFGTGLNISEGSYLTRDAACEVLSFCKELAIQREKPYIRLNIPSHHMLVQVALDWGGQDIGTYAWQIYVPDVAALLSRLTPVFERRIAESGFVGLTRTLLFNLYREAFELEFQEGKLIAVKPVGFREWGDFRMPPQLVAPLILGHRSRKELVHAYPDVGGDSPELIDILFPKLRSFIYTSY